MFVPCAFIGGITGQFFRQFALTIAASTVISAINAVTLKPAQCAVYLRPTKARKNIFYRAFNRVYDACEAVYTAIVKRLVRHTVLVMLLFVAFGAFTSWWFVRIPTGFLPTEDQGFAIVALQLPDAASQTRTRAVIGQVNEILRNTPGVRGWFLLGGQSILDQAVASNAAAMYVTLTPWEDRTGNPALARRDHRQPDGPVSTGPRGDDLRLSAAGHHGPGRGGRF